MSSSSSSSSSNALDVTLVDITKNNVEQLRLINSTTLPVSYSDKFYRDLVEKSLPEYVKFATWNGFSVAAVCARVEPHETVADASKLYIMTINVLAAYRRRGIGAKLLNHVLETAKKDPSIIEVYLHVQTSNDDAKQFYLAHGFVQTDIIKGYYKRIEPPDCFLLKKSLKEGHDVASPSSTEQ
jgi:ribosomal protein S18 acetylase RimI-like enzyme